MKIVRPYAITDTVLTTSNVTEDDYLEYDGETTYILGAMIIMLGTNLHKIYESLQAGNIGHDPTESPDWWLDRGATNRWKMFDVLVNSQTENSDDIEFTLVVPGRANSIALLNIYGSAVRVVGTDVVDGVVFDRTIDMRSNMGIVDWWSYLFEPPEYDADTIITDLPLYSNLSLAVTITAISDVAKCGACIIGLVKTIGGTQYGASVGIQDYSVKSRDTWGNYTVLERAFNKRANYTVEVENSGVDKLQNILAGFRAVPILYIGTDQFGSTAILGFYKDFSIAIAYFSYSICTIEIEGLI